MDGGRHRKSIITLTINPLLISFCDERNIAIRLQLVQKAKYTTRITQGSQWSDWTQLIT